ncbi:MAG: rod shape-determining protein MreD [Deltaproteobacteria bacterium]
MIDPFLVRLWLHRALFILVAAVIIFIKILPISLPIDRWPAPDLLLAMTLVWIMRRPDYVPVLSIALVFLVSDIMLQRPPGLLAAIMVGATEFIRGRLILWRDWTFPVEWLVMAAVMIAIAMVNRIGLTLFFVPRPGVGSILLQAMLTALTYPIVAGFAVFVLGIRRIVAGDIDVMSRRV